MSCDRGMLEIYVAAQDFRFTPNEIHLAAQRPARLTIRNEGRERHEFASPLVNLAAHDAVRTDTDRAGITILPGQSFALQFTPEAGTYEIRCLIKGHAGMRGIIVVEG